MMKKYLFLIASIFVLIVIIGVGMFKNSSEGDFKPSVYRLANMDLNGKYFGYKFTLEAEYLYCSVRINGINIVNNIGMSEGFAQTYTGFNEFLQNGNNEIAIDIAPLWWFNESKTGIRDEGKKAHAKGAFCEIIIEESEYKNNDKETVNLAILKLSINEEGQVDIDKRSYRFDPANSPNSSLILSNVFRGDVDGLKNFDSLKRNLYIKDFPEWLWTKSPVYKNIPNNRALLEEAYLELRDAILKKDEGKIKNLIDIALYESTLGSIMIPDSELINKIIPMNYASMGYDKLDAIKGLVPIDFKNLQWLNMLMEK